MPTADERGLHCLKFSQWAPGQRHENRSWHAPGKSPKPGGTRACGGKECLSVLDQALESVGEAKSIETWDAEKRVKEARSAVQSAHDRVQEDYTQVNQQIDDYMCRFHSSACGEGEPKAKDSGKKPRNT